MRRSPLFTVGWLAVSVVLAVALVAEGRDIWRQARQRRQLALATHDWQERLRQLASERDATLAAATTALATQRDKDDPGRIESRVRRYLARIDDLQEVATRVPSVAIPEMRYLTTDDWLHVAIDLPTLETNDDFRRALAELRRVAKRHVAASLQSSLLNYPGSVERIRTTVRDVAELAPYCRPPLPPEVLDRYEIVPLGETVNGLDAVIREKDALALDRTYDALAVIVPNRSDVWVRPMTN